MELQIKQKSSNFKWYGLIKLLKRNVKKQRKCSPQNTPGKKGNLTEKLTKSFIYREVLKNWRSLKHWNNEELDLLKVWLHQSLPPSKNYETHYCLKHSWIRETKVFIRGWNTGEYGDIQCIREQWSIKLRILCQCS